LFGDNILNHSDEGLVKGLDALIRACRDGERDCTRHAAQAQSMRLQWQLTQRAQCLRKAGAELQALRVRYAGAALPQHGAADSLPRDTDGDVASDEALLVECERAEDAALQRYRSVLDEDLPIVVRAVAQRHCDATQSQRAQLRSLRAEVQPQRAPSDARDGNSRQAA
jgi:uncharacterized protein (TIGR02284 family)